MYDVILGKNIFKNHIKFQQGPSLESQVSSISDDIAYNSHDLEDGIKANLFNIDELVDVPVLSEIVYKHKKKLNKNNKELVLRQIIRDTINEMVKDIIINTKKNLKENKIMNIKDVYNSKINLVSFSDKMNQFDSSIKYFIMEKMYQNHEVLKKATKGKKIISSLFSIINKNPKKYIKKDMIIKNKKETVVCDFIAGMTDRYSINLYNSIK